MTMKFESIKKFESIASDLQNAIKGGGDDGEKTYVGCRGDIVSSDGSRGADMGCGGTIRGWGQGVTRWF